MLEDMYINQFYGKPEDLHKNISKKSKQELSQLLYESIISCREWEKIVDSSLDGIFISDSEGKALYANSAYEKMSGLRMEEIQGVHLQEFLDKKYVTKSGILIVMETKEPVTIESYFPRTGKYSLVTCNPILTEDGKVSLIVSNVRDLTEINRLKEQAAKDQAMVHRYKSELEIIKKQIYSRADFIARDPIMLDMLQLANRIAQVDATALITGETGVGKEEVAKYIHDNSRRQKDNFIKVNCSTIAESLFESELFGYEKGAFTGAKNEGKIGLFEAADKGTIFLDEIGEMPLIMQAKLLRVLQDKEIIRVGAVTPTKVDVRILAATNRNLEQMVEEKQFRMDLYYRLNVFPVHIPPLRERKQDIQPLAEYFLEEMNQKYDFRKSLSKEMVQVMQEYAWPGNVRELRNLIERATVMSLEDEMEILELFTISKENMESEISDASVNLEEQLKKFEYSYMKKAYRKYGNIREAAESLLMKRSTFAGKFKAYQEKFD